jgi:uncharacterized membrane protein YhaH (DUF805 family)
MPGEPQRSKFWVSMFALILYTVACGAIPIYHQASGRDLKPVVSVNLDSVYLFIFLLGTATIVVAFGLNRRIDALEKKNAMPEGDKNAG